MALKLAIVTMTELTDPFVMSLVDMLVYPRVMFQSVNPVDCKVGEEQENDSACHQPWPPILVHPVVQFRMSSNLSKKPGQHHKVYPRCGHHTRLDLHPDLVLQETRVMFQSVVEEDVVRYGAEQEVEYEGSNECDGPHGDALSYH